MALFIVVVERSCHTFPGNYHTTLKIMLSSVKPLNTKECWGFTMELISPFYLLNIKEIT